MGYRAEDGKWVDSCLAKVKPGEPIFVLRAQDLTAPETVERWAMLAEANGCGRAKVVEALQCAEEMRRWAKEHGGKFPD